MKRLPLVLLLVLAACTGNGVGETTTTTSTVAPETTTSTVESTTTTEMEQPPGIEDLPEELQLELEALIDITEENRELSFLEAPLINVVTPEELERLVREDIEESLEDVEVDEALNDLLGLIEPETSLIELYSSVLGEQVAGFYDPDTRELVVPMREDTFGALERSTIVHELTHALTDQHFDFGSYYEQLFDEDRYDEAAAYQALIEGDAVYTELRYLIGLDPDQQRQILQESLDIESGALDAAPRYIQESLIFPYVRGQMFVEAIAASGTEGINEAYDNPPVSSEQIITPTDYGSDLPIELEMPVLSLDGYESAYTSTWGELSFELMFNQVLGGDDAASGGWGGDRYEVFFDGEDVAMVLTYAGDAPSDLTEMNDALTSYLAETIQPDEFGEVWIDGNRLWMVVASKPSAGQSLIGQVGE